MNILFAYGLKIIIQRKKYFEKIQFASFISNRNCALCKTKIFDVRHFEFNLFNLLKVARWKKLNSINSHHTANWNFPTTELGVRWFFVVFVRETTEFLTAKHGLS